MECGVVDLVGVGAAARLAVLYIPATRTALSFLALTTPPMFAGLAAVADGVIASMRVSDGLAAAAPAATAAALAGSYWRYSGSSSAYSGSSWSSESSLALSADGRYRYGSENAGSTRLGGFVGTHDYEGRWVVLSGAGDCGTLEFVSDSGSRRVVQYVVSMDPRDRSGYGPAVVFDGVKYQRTG
jgi:hypothetical protein